jgi:hypothetical protein
VKTTITIAVKRDIISIETACKTPDFTPLRTLPRKFVSIGLKDSIEHMEINTLESAL